MTVHRHTNTVSDEGDDGFCDVCRPSHLLGYSVKEIYEIPPETPSDAAPVVITDEELRSVWNAQFVDLGQPQIDSIKAAIAAVVTRHLAHPEDTPPSTDSGEVVNELVVGVNEPTEEMVEAIEYEIERCAKWGEQLRQRGDDETSMALNNVAREVRGIVIRLKAALAAAQPDKKEK